MSTPPTLFIGYGTALPFLRAPFAYLVGVEPPEVEFLLKQRTTHVGWVVQFAGPVVVENLPQQQHERHTHEVTSRSLWSR